MHTSKKIRWFAGVWALVVLTVLVIYIYKAWHNGSVSIFGRQGSTPFSRQSDPFMYWVMMSFYVTLAFGFVLLVSVGFHNLLYKAA